MTLTPPTPHVSCPAETVLARTRLELCLARVMQSLQEVRTQIPVIFSWASLCPGAMEAFWHARRIRKVTGTLETVAGSMMLARLSGLRV